MDTELAPAPDLSFVEGPRHIIPMYGPAIPLCGAPSLIGSAKVNLPATCPACLVELG